LFRPWNIGKVLYLFVYSHENNSVIENNCLLFVQNRCFAEKIQLKTLVLGKLITRRVISARISVAAYSRLILSHAPVNLTIYPLFWRRIERLQRMNRMFSCSEVTPETILTYLNKNDHKIR